MHIHKITVAHNSHMCNCFQMTKIKITESEHWLWPCQLCSYCHTRRSQSCFDKCTTKTSDLTEMVRAHVAILWKSTFPLSSVTGLIVRSNHCSSSITQLQYTYHPAPLESTFFWLTKSKLYGNSNDGRVESDFHLSCLARTIKSLMYHSQLRKLWRD